MIRDQHFGVLSFTVSNYKCNLICFNFEFVIRKQNSKSVSFELLTRSVGFYV